MIPQKNISILSNRLAADGGRRIPEAVLERDYCIAWLLIGAVQTKLPELLVFKGGTALKRCHFGNYRFSEDLDFTLLQNSTLDSALQELEGAYAEANRLSGITLKHSRRETTAGLNSHTFYIGYEGPLPAAVRQKEIKVDITLSEALVFDIERRAVLRAYDEFADLPENQQISVYSLNEIAAEKSVALLDPARTEPRDLYDLWYLISEAGLDLRDLVFAIETKLEFRSRKLIDVAANFGKKEPRYKALWTSRLENQMVALPKFEDTYRLVQRSLRQAGLVSRN